mgnify:CR=1 FL=1
MNERDAERILEELVAKEKPEDVKKVDEQFARRMERLKGDKKAPAGMLDQAQVLWKMLKAPDSVVPFKSKAWIMAALSYLVSPLDIIPDKLGYAGHLDDAMIIRIVYNRLHDEIDAFRAHRAD